MNIELSTDELEILLSALDCASHEYGLEDDEVKLEDRLKKLLNDNKTD